MLIARPPPGLIHGKHFQQFESDVTSANDRRNYTYQAAQPCPPRNRHGFSNWNGPVAILCAHQILVDIVSNVKSEYSRKCLKSPRCSFSPSSFLRRLLLFTYEQIVWSTLSALTPGSQHFPGKM